MDLKPYQKEILNRMPAITYNGESAFQYISKRIDKTTSIRFVAKQYTAMREEANINYKHISSAQVDGESWHTVRCSKEISKWIKTHSTSWHEHIDDNWNLFANTFDISEELYMMLVLKFGK
jgi:hypothetical protein